MPITIRQGGGGRAPLSTYAPSEPLDAEFTSEPVEPTTDDGPGVGTALLGGAAALATALALRNPSAARGVAGKVGNALNEFRYGSMLSGMAVPKSVMGNVGAAVVSAAERRSMAPIREFASRQTISDWVNAMRSGNALGQAAGGTAQSGITQGSSLLNLPGRIIGAGDVATRNALIRAGLTDKEAGIQLMQRELPPALKEPFDNPLARWLFPFRTVPLNTFLEGMRRLDPTAKNAHRGISAAAMGAGAVSGAVSEDPRTVAMTAPLAGTYALPYIVGGMLGKYATGDGSVGPAKQVASGVSPYSDYAIGTMLDPLRPYTKPAALTALDYLFGARGGGE